MQNLPVCLSSIILTYKENNRPDILLLDVHLKGKLDGIETAAQLQQKNIPVIYLTANSDDTTFNRANSRSRNSCGFTAPISSISLISMKYWKQMSSSGINRYPSAPACAVNSMLAWFYPSAYYTELNKDSALYYGILQRRLAQQLGQRLWESDACFQTAYLYFGLGNYPAALTAVTDGLAITEAASSENDAWHIGTLAGDGNPHSARLYIAASLHQIFAFLQLISLLTQQLDATMREHTDRGTHLSFTFKPVDAA